MDSAREGLYSVKTARSPVSTSALALARTSMNFKPGDIVTYGDLVMQLDRIETVHAGEPLWWATWPTSHIEGVPEIKNELLAPERSLRRARPELALGQHPEVPRDCPYRWPLSENPEELHSA
jgi:hypothetical protein